MMQASRNHHVISESQVLTQFLKNGFLTQECESDILGFFKSFFLTSGALQLGTYVSKLPVDSLEKCLLISNSARELCNISILKI